MKKPNFSPAEFVCRDGTAYPSKWIGSRLARLIAVLEVIRAAAGCRIFIVSGYRTEAYNRKIGGARQSRHVTGEAADIRAEALNAADLHALILSLYNGGKLDDLGGLGAYPNWVHVDVRDGARLVRWGGSRVEGTATA